MQAVWKAALAAAVCGAVVSAARLAPAEDDGFGGWRPDVGTDSDQSLSVQVTPAPPATLLEKTLRSRGTLVTARYSDAASLPAEQGGSIRILALQAAAEGDPVRGIMLEVQSRAGFSATGYVDEKELAQLVTTLPQMTRVDRAGSSLPHVATRYCTAGGTSFTYVEVNGTRMIRITAMQVLESGRVLTTSCNVGIGAFTQFTQGLAAAARSLDAIKNP